MKIQHRSELGKLMEHMGIMGPCAEIGVAEGRYSKEICEWGAPKVYLVDRWMSVPTQRGDAGSPQGWHDSNFKMCQASVAGYNVEFLRGDSVEMASNVPDGSLSLVYIDADHSYEGVKRDIAAWFPKLMAGGIFAFHDYLSEAYGVRRAVEEFCGDKYQIELLMENGEIENVGAYFIKHKD
jgi:hypothetical protein